MPVFCESGSWLKNHECEGEWLSPIQVPWVSRYADPVMATGYHMLLGGLPLLALSIIREGNVLLERLPQITGNHLTHLDLFMFFTLKKSLPFISQGGGVPNPSEQPDVYGANAKAIIF